MAIPLLQSLSFWSSSTTTSHEPSTPLVRVPQQLVWLLLCPRIPRPETSPSRQELSCLQTMVSAALMSLTRCRKETPLPFTRPWSSKQYPLPRQAYRPLLMQGVPFLLPWILSWVVMTRPRTSSPTSDCRRHWCHDLISFLWWLMTVESR